MHGCVFQIALTDAQKDALVAKLKSMVAKADAKYEVTVAMLKRSARCKASPSGCMLVLSLLRGEAWSAQIRHVVTAQIRHAFVNSCFMLSCHGFSCHDMCKQASIRSISRALHERNIYFRKLNEKPTLTTQDIKDRKEFASKYANKPLSWWQSYVHLHIDVKHFAIYLNGKGRRYVAQVGTRGAYRNLGEKFAKGTVKPNPKLKYNPGVRGAKVLAGVGNGKVLLWHFIETRWNGAVAAAAYKGPVLGALQKAFPGKRGFRVLEDNDPSGFKSSKGITAKQEAKIFPFEIPKRSPDLNVCDYALWKEVNKRMRLQEKSWPESKKETRGEFLARLRRTATRLPTSFIEKAVGDMKNRCQKLRAAEGYHIEEGGRRT